MPGRRGHLRQGLSNQRHPQLPLEVVGRTTVLLPTFTPGITHARHNSVHLTVIINDLRIPALLEIQHACSQTVTTPLPCLSNRSPSSLPLLEVSLLP